MMSPDFQVALRTSMLSKYSFIQTIQSVLIKTLSYFTQISGFYIVLIGNWLTEKEHLQ